jgi:SAM-dependent methyltransferase
MPREPSDAWASGAAYEPYIGRWSRRIARDFVPSLAVPGDSTWLDVGCGTGALSEAILARGFPHRLRGIDPSPDFIAFTRRALPDPRATFDIGDAQALPVDDAACDAAVSGLALNFVPDPQRAARELRRVTRPGGTVAAYVWDYAGEMQLIRRFWDAAIALDPAAAPLDEARRFPLCAPAPLTALFASAGLASIEVGALEIPTVFADFADYWTPFLGGQGPAPGYCAALSDAARTALRDHLRATLPARPDGTIHLIARAWCIRATVPPS